MSPWEYVKKRISWDGGTHHLSSRRSRVRGRDGPDGGVQQEMPDMTRAAKDLLFWTPRVLTIAFILFLGLFALDVFGEGYGFWGTLAALLMHLIPNFVLVGVLALAWKREWVGGVLFLGLGVFYLVETWGRFHWSAYVAISGSLFLIGILFSLNWIFRGKLSAPVPQGG
jgi:hypothetical protein